MTFFHRHLPTFTRFSKLIVWKWMHLYFPMAIHFLTDKYEGRLHHLVVDTIYAALSILLVAANVGLGIWFYFYLTPADVEVRISVDSSIQSGQKTVVHIQYANYGRRVSNAHLYVTLPDGFSTGGDEAEKEFVDFEIGDLPEYSNGYISVPGIVYGNIDQVYLLEADLSYTTLRQQETVRAADRFFINDSAFELSVDVPKAAAYNIPTTYTVHYENTGNGPFDDAKLHINFPDYFAVTGAELNAISQNLSADTREFYLGHINPHEKGTLTITGIFRGDVRSVGDQDVQITIIPYLSVYQHRLQSSVEFTYKSFFALTHVIDPYVELSVLGDTAETYGNTVDYRVVVKNTSASAVEQIKVFGTLSGKALLPYLTRINGVRAGSSSYLTFPVIDRLEPQEQKIFTVSIPTQYTTEANQVASLYVSGEAHSPLIDAGFDTYGDSLSTRFASRINVSAAALYTGPNGEQLGYGPEHPTAWNITAFRVFLRVDNGNQPVSNVKVTTTLPGMSTWTGSYSTSTGTLSYDAASRRVTWTIPTLPANAKNLGAQFEVRFLPNHLQIGLSPHIINDVFASAYDPFAGLSVSASHGSVNSAPILP